MLKASNLSKIYNGNTALNNTSIYLKSGTVSGLLGKNGAGKTTLFKIICRLVKPDSGTIHIESNKKKAIGAIIEKPGLYTYLNAFENLRLFGKIQNLQLNDKQLEKALLEVGLPINRKDPVKNFSMGMKQRLGIAIALLNDPDVLILDEPFSGLDPIGVSAMIKLIKKLAHKGIAIFISSHLMTELQKCCDYLYVIDQGKIIEEGATGELMNKLTSSYTISGSDISKALWLHDITTRVHHKNSITVQCTSEEISTILKKLLNEGYSISACVPNASLQQFLETPRS
ncbi:ABC-2 type transport system ATP-binding protein/bacitracin transport system ATP-binding protein [Pustulibacterium marinum]|uniref:ABC-2 type transport system ATP-binding protein/bacitracin transport system ATP-binding protein n=1 Tax=Pustulibacterium marinum TaxID=1224947 RepID=A0A1I7GQD2_9FLAO|nr:ABC transporter ATP-binding protein [Pustulibacterium marinum]SFU50655.1 ABC-2 type transport system ATP-binding protein/bacitracin transport system ATP-binding protein [Pustulibacterium marinum]